MYERRRSSVSRRMDDASGVSTDALAARRGLQVVRGRQERLLHLAVGRTEEIVHRGAMPLPAAQRCPHRLANYGEDRTAAHRAPLTHPFEFDAFRYEPFVGTQMRLAQ